MYAAALWDVSTICELFACSLREIIRNKEQTCFRDFLNICVSLWYLLAKKRRMLSNVDN